MHGDVKLAHDKRAAYWNGQLDLPADHGTGEQIAKLFNSFSVRPTWVLGRAERHEQLIAEALEPLELPPTIICSVERTAHTMNNIRFETEDHFGFGRFYGSNIEDKNFKTILDEFFAEQLHHNMAQREFQNILTKRFGRHPQKEYNLRGDAEFHGSLGTLRDAISGTVFSRLFYIMAENVGDIGKRLVQAVVDGNTVKAELLGNLLTMFALGFPIVEIFHGKPMILEY